MNEYKAENQRCPNRRCETYLQSIQDNIAIHDRQQNRFRCRTCGKTWVGHAKEPHFGLRKDPVKIKRAFDFLDAGLPIRKIAEFMKVSPSTVLRWKKRKKNHNFIIF
jgi:transposase-like protein